MSCAPKPRYRPPPLTPHLTFGLAPRHLLKLPVEEVKEVLGDKLTDVTLELYNFICDKLPPTPSRFHYVFNLRDLSRVYEVGLGRAWGGLGGTGGAGGHWGQTSHM